MPYVTEPQYNDPDDVSGPDDVRLPSYPHYTKIRAELSRLAEAGCITDEEADELYGEWKARD